MDKILLNRETCTIPFETWPKKRPVASQLVRRVPSTVATPFFWVVDSGVDGWRKLIIDEEGAHSLKLPISQGIFPTLFVLHP